MKNQHHREVVQHPPSSADTPTAKSWHTALLDDPIIGPRIREVRAILARDAPSRRAALMDTLADLEWHGNKELGACVEEDVDAIRSMLAGTGIHIACHRGIGTWSWGYRLYPTLKALQEANNAWRGPEHDGACYGGPCTHCGKPVRGILYYVQYSYWNAGGTDGLSFYYAHKECHERVQRHEVCSVCGSTFASYNHLKENWFCDADNPNLQKTWEKRLNRRHQGRSAKDFRITSTP